MEERAIDDTVDGRSEAPALNPGQNMLPSTSGRFEAKTGFSRVEKLDAASCAGCPG
jgi:hypothetical protein